MSGCEQNQLIGPRSSVLWLAVAEQTFEAVSCCLFSKRLSAAPDHRCVALQYVLPESIPVRSALAFCQPRGLSLVSNCNRCWSVLDALGIFCCCDELHHPGTRDVAARWRDCNQQNRSIGYWHRRATCVQICPACSCVHPQHAWGCGLLMMLAYQCRRHVAVFKCGAGQLSCRKRGCCAAWLCRGCSDACCGGQAQDTEKAAACWGITRVS